MADEAARERARIQRDKVSPVLPGFGLAVGAIPFFVSLRTTHESSYDVTANGVEIRSVTRVNAFDHVAVPCGAFALALGFVGLVRGVWAKKALVIVVGVAAMALGLYQAVRGFVH